MSKDKKQDECESCGFECEVTKYNTGAPMSEDHFYCDLCASTMTSRFAHELRISQPSNRDVMQTVCYVGNAIIEAIRSKP
jgi:hypothetical protein